MSHGSMEPFCHFRLQNKRSCLIYSFSFSTSVCIFFLVRNSLIQLFFGIDNTRLVNGYGHRLNCMELLLDGDIVEKAE
jgi:hypothetical protein